jgi:lysophospholipase L1-like esterase/pimeloyl-ACP methyl ester carboxylesterase
MRRSVLRQLSWCLLSLVFFGPAWTTAAQPEKNRTPTRVACIGDSITAGSGTRLPALEAYPAQLQRMLDPQRWWVRGFGISGATLLKNGDKPYQAQSAFQEALRFNPEVVVIMLGTNDSKPQNWKWREQFASDYRDLIGKFQALPTKPRIFICRPPVVIGGGRYDITASVVDEELPLIDAIANEAKVELIDQHATLAAHDALIPDQVHPNTEGAGLLARKVYQALTGREFSGALDPVLHGEWMGYVRIDFESKGRAAFVVFPKTPVPGRPWIWRPEFFGTEPQTEVALLEKGWHAAYVDVRNLYGAPPALDAMDDFYAQVTKDYALAPRVVLAGFSRGGLFAFNWAARHPERVASLYVDAPVLDFKSWPGGKGKGPGSPEDWARCLKVYGLTEEQAMSYPLNPLDNLPPLAAAKIPILSVCGDADRTVPFEENTQILEQRYKKLGGEIRVIVKPGGDHHPHSLADPAPIVAFILQHAPK